MNLDGKGGGKDHEEKEYNENRLCEKLKLKNTLKKEEKGGWQCSPVEEELLSMFKVLMPPQISQN